MNSVSIVSAGITELETDAIVNAANSSLLQGGGVCGVIFRAAGAAQLQQACDSIGHCPTGSAVITPAFNIHSAKYIIHAVGPVWSGGTRREAELLYSAYQSALELALQNGCASVGFPLISSGIYGYPLEGAWEAALQACNDFFNTHPGCDLKVRFGVPDAGKRAVGLEALRRYS